jgi:hypothetical protein
LGFLPRDEYQQKFFGHVCLHLPFYGLNFPLYMPEIQKVYRTAKSLLAGDRDLTLGSNVNEFIDWY